MTLRTRLTFRNPDLTSDINYRLRDLIGKGVFYTPQAVVPIAGSLEVAVLPFAAMGADGMVTSLETGTETLTVQAGVAQWVLLHAEYVANAPAIAVLEVLTESEYNALSTVEKIARVKLAKVTLASTAGEVMADDISFVDADIIDSVGRSAFRGVVDTVANLPDYSDPASGITTQNRAYDFYYVADERIFYSWSVTGTPQWAPIISAAEEVALRNHKMNQDDGTDPPDFFNAQHVLVKHRESLDAGTASVATYGSEGEDFGSSNPLVDGAYRIAAVRRVDVTGLVGALGFQLSGSYYVGTGAIGTADAFFRLATYQQDAQLVALNRAPITIASVYRSDSTFELDPSADADALGYYDDPVINFNFTGTGIANFTGNLSVYCSPERTQGSVTAADYSIGHQGLGFVRPAQDIPVIGQNFDVITTATDDIQEALENLDAILYLYFGYAPSPTAGYTALSRTMRGLTLSAGEMSTVNQYTAAVKFMSSDAQFTTENPKLLAAITGRATESYAANTDGGMAIDFFATPINPGATNVPIRGMTLESGEPYSTGRLAIEDTAIATPSWMPTKLAVQWNSYTHAADKAAVTISADVQSISATEDAWGLGVRTWNRAASGSVYATGIRSEVGLAGAGSLPTADALNVGVYNTGAGTITSGTGLHVNDGTNSGTFTNYYGVRVDSLTCATNTYGVYIAGANKYALWVESGDTKLEGRVALGLAGISNAAELIVSCNSSTFGYAGYFFTTIDTNEPDITGGLWAYLNVDCTTGQTAADLRGVYSILDKDGDGGISVWYGYRAYAQLDGGTVSNLTGYHSAGGIGAATASVVTSGYHFRAAGYTVVTGSIANQYGLYVDNLTQASTGNYGVRIVGASPGYAIYVDSGLSAIGGDLRLFGSNATISLKAGTTGTTGKLRFTFDTDATEYGLLALPYDTRTTVGLSLKSATLPVTYDATEHKWNLVGVQKMCMNTSGYVGIGSTFTAPDCLLHVYNGSSGASIPLANTHVCVESNGTAYYSVLTPAANFGGLICGQPTKLDAGRWVYAHGNTLPGWQLYVDQLFTMKVDSARRMWFGYSEDWSNQFTGASVPTGVQLVNIAGDASAAGNAGIGLWTNTTNWFIENDGTAGTLKFKTTTADVLTLGSTSVTMRTGTATGITPASGSSLVIDDGEVPIVSFLTTDTNFFYFFSLNAPTPATAFAHVTVYANAGLGPSGRYHYVFSLYAPGAASRQNALIVANLENDVYTSPPSYGRVLVNILNCNYVAPTNGAVFTSLTSAPTNTVGTLWLQDSRPYINTTGTAGGHHAISHNITPFSTNVTVNVTSTFTESSVLATIPANTTNVGQAFRLTICAYLNNVSSPDAPEIFLRFKDGASATLTLVSTSLGSIANLQPVVFQVDAQLRASSVCHMFSTCRHFGAGGANIIKHNCEFSSSGKTLTPTTDATFYVAGDAGGSGTFDIIITNVLLEMM